MSRLLSKYSYFLFILFSLCLLGGFFIFSGRQLNDASDAFLFLPITSDKMDKEHSLVLASPAKEPITLIFGGDVMLSRTVNAKMFSYGNYLWPFQEIASTTAEADITIFNLESPFLKEADYRVPSGSFSFKADPQALSGLILSGVDVLSLANNHILNASEQGIKDSLSLLTGERIAVVGAGMNETEARRGAIIERGTWKVAFLSYAYPQDNSVASAENAGIASLDMANLRADISRLRPQADLIVVLIHAGLEYVSQPNESQKQFAHMAIESGADAVIGHHPHWLQSWEIYQGKPIFYSLGNLVFDQMWSQATSQGLLLRLTFATDLSGRAEFMPLIIKDYGQAVFWPEDKPLADFWLPYDLPPTFDLDWPAPENN